MQPLKWKMTRILPIAALVLFVLVSCQATPDPVSLSAEENKPISDQPAEQTLPQPERPSKKESNGLEISSTQQQDEADSSEPQAELNPPRVEVTEVQTTTQEASTPARKLEQFTLSHPRLMGLSVGDNQELIAQLHSQPKEISTLVEEERKLTIHHYEGFMVGVNAQQTIEFITVLSRNIEPGLNGFRIGHTSAEAIKLLGEPTTKNDYVITYLGNDMMLKLDVDPVTSEVISARLFSEVEA